MSAYVLGSDAVLDLEDIWNYIASDSMDAADRWIAKLLDAFEDIARMPGIGTATRTSPIIQSCSGHSGLT